MSEKMADLRRAEEAVEVLAAVEHERWSGWMRYLFSRCNDTGDGCLEMTAQDVARWSRQQAMTYDQLTEAEKESDRIEARKSLAALEALHAPTPPVEEAKP